MDLQTQRRLEHFAQLADLPVIRIEPCMEFVLPPFRLYIEVIDERVMMTVAVRVATVDRSRVLKALLARCHPALLQGIPLRAYAARDFQFLSCSPAANSDAGHWLTCYRVMCRLLDTHAGTHA
ncbi:MAG TPA: secretion protein [Trinickia sp.]|jgi:type III secretion system chaperone SycN|uniref:secretion protein n=1 Tax=Trinickia sp. TaxID=2571163 RepID=UPI002B9694B1|nr:secretion protein [Trinickia sp.]HTI18312.1 secretion protein [Trinickia sp.]